MQVTIEIKTLLSAIQTYNPDADLTGLKAYLFDVMLDPEGVENVPAPVVTKPRPMRPTPAPTRKEPAAIAQAVEAATVADGTDPNYNPYVDDLSPHPPANLKPETFDLEGEGGDPVAELAAKAVGSVAPSPPPIQKGGKKSIKDRKAEREAKRKEVANFANMTSKEIMEQLTQRALPKKKEGQNQFVDLGDTDEDHQPGDLEMG